MTRPKGSKNKATKKWEAYWLNKKKWKAYFKAKEEYLKKNPLEALKNWLKQIDPLEFAAIISTTYVIHAIIQTTSELFQRATNINSGIRIISGSPEFIKNLPWGNLPLIGNLYDLPFLINTILNAQNISEERKQEIIKGATTILKNPQDDSILLWAISFSIAYYVQKHGITDILGSIKGFLGIGAAAT